MTIYYFAPDVSKPIGGCKHLYRHVDILNSAGISAKVLHTKPGFRYQWFENKTSIAYLGSSWQEGVKKIVTSLQKKEYFASPPTGIQEGVKLYGEDAQITQEDILVFPEYFGKSLRNLAPGLRKVIFNQNVHGTFYKYSLDSLLTLLEPYDDPDLLGVMTISDHSMRYLHYGFPTLMVKRVVDGVDQTVFQYGAEKKKQIALMPRKCFDEVVQVLSLLKKRNVFKGWEIAVIENASEKEVAKILQESQIFLCFGTQEGFQLPPVEAAFCGCTIVGYTGFGGEEYFLPEYTHPIQQGDVLQFAQTVEALLKEIERNPKAIEKKREEYSHWMQKRYSLESERQSVLDFWNSL